MPVPPADLDIDEALVRGLLRAQHPDLAGLPLSAAGNGWDNATWRLGDELAVRLPRRAFAVELVGHEHRWLPELAARVAAPVPVPLRVGAPTGAYPWPWSIVPWLAGETADRRTLGPAGVQALGWALHTLHVRPPPDAPLNPYRGGPLDAREDPRPALAALYDAAPPRALERVWRRALEAEPQAWPVWTHGDLHARNVVVGDGGVLAGIIDWGDLGAADPAVDLSVVWTLLEPGLHGAFCAGYGPVEGALHARARGWALVFGVLFAGLADDAAAQALGRRTLDRLQQ